jgi:hypothetical protein
MNIPTQPQENYEEPKLALTLSFIRRIDDIENLIDNGRFSDALRAMCTFINRIYIIPTRTDVLQIKDDLNKNQKNSYLCASSVQGYFSTINNYMNETYFADFHGRAKPRNAATPMLKLPEAKVTI